jgi:hypothetical protein
MPSGISHAARWPRDDQPPMGVHQRHDSCALSALGRLHSGDVSGSRSPREVLAPPSSGRYRSLPLVMSASGGSTTASSSPAGTRKPPRHGPPARTPSPSPCRAPVSITQAPAVITVRRASALSTPTELPRT